MIWKEKKMKEEIPYKYESIGEINVYIHGEEKKS